MSFDTQLINLSGLIFVDLILLMWAGERLDLSKPEDINPCLSNENVKDGRENGTDFLKNRSLPGCEFQAC